jgi:NAD(P)-dependent dehydrogenase (short-subunit alcohol dehydrogenase family)
MKTVLVTGASTGIGRATALRLDAAGWKVYAGVRSDEAGAVLAGLASERLQPLIVDVTDAATCAAAMATVGGSLDGLVNNAGIAVGGPLETVALDELRNQLEVNVVGQVAMTQAALPALRAARGRIVFTSSVGGKMAAPFIGPYAASKFALEAIADSLRIELMQWGIEVCVVAPGSVATPIWDKGAGQIDDVTGGMTDAQRSLYAGSIEAFRKVLIDTGKRGVAPEKVAAAIEDALTASRPRLRRGIGLDARGQLAAASVLPKRVMNKIVVRVMGLPR